MDGFLPGEGWFYDPPYTETTADGVLRIEITKGRQLRTVWPLVIGLGVGYAIMVAAGKV